LAEDFAEAEDVTSAALNDLLKNVSRSFYLTLRVLPASVRPQIGLAYLLARATDTVADTTVIPVEERLETLRRLRERISGESAKALDLRPVGEGAEQQLLANVEYVLRTFGNFSPADQQHIRELLEIIISGQELDLVRFGNAKAVVALATAEELDDYTYRVAGCVGEFWTRMCRAHVFPNAAVDDKFLLENGVQFGKGLQLVNILRDVPRDLRNNRCYLPEQELAKVGLRPEALLVPANEPALRPVYNRWLAQAEAYLRAGWAYTNALPRDHARVRLACAWPILIGLRTIERLKVEPVLAPDRRIKVSRAEVRSMLVRSLVLYPFSKAWAAQATDSVGHEVRSF
jgi:farnesyl-diphosphate farnesyltransferase